MRSMIQSIKGALLLMPVLALASPAFAQIIPITLNDSELPGSVIVFPKFINMPQVVVDVTPTNPLGITVSRTEIELGAVCPTGQVCPEGTKVKVRLHWVCPATEEVNSNICAEQGFDITTLTINGKVAFTADGLPINAATPNVPAAPCPRGYLIAWVENTDDQPIKFDALLGNAVTRGPNVTVGPAPGFTESTAVSAYNAIPIQANTLDAGPASPPVTLATFVNSTTLSQPLLFNGAAGGYQQLTDVQVGDVRFDQLTTAAGTVAPPVLSSTSLVFLTLDVQSGLPNNPIFVPLSFYNELEVLTSVDGFEFTCWVQAALTLPTPAGVVGLTTIDASGLNLTQVKQGTRKGIVIAGPAHKVDIGSGDPESGFSTLIGIVEVNEGTSPNFAERKYNFGMNSAFVNGGALDSTTIPTSVVTTTMFIP
jgi:hypothetical protein